MYFKIFFTLLLISLSFRCFADGYKLWVDNNTNDVFSVEEAGSQSLLNLQPQEKDKLYEFEWATNQVGTTLFLGRFYVANKGQYELFVTNEKVNGRDLRCWSPAYECQVMAYNDNEGKLTINYRDPN